MKCFHLLGASLFRHKTRTLLTLVSIITAFMLFGVLDAVRTSFSQAGQSINGAQRLQTGSKLSFMQTLPQALRGKIQQIPGVKAVSYANWFGGAYQDPHNLVFSFAVAPNYLELFPEIQITSGERQSFEHTAMGALVGERLMQRFHWKIGDRIPLQSTMFPDKDGNKNWEFEIVGTMHAKDKGSGSFFDQLFLLHWKYFDDTTPYNRGQVGWYVTRVTDVNQSDRVAKAIDALSANSDSPTLTQSEQAASANWMKQLANIGFIVDSIMGAVFFTLLLLAGNTMMLAVRERTTELAVMKTIGFSDISLLAIVLSESVLLLVLGGLIGMGLAALVVPGIAANSGGMLNLPGIRVETWMLALAWMTLVGVMVGAFPALKAKRLNIVDALAGR